MSGELQVVFIYDTQRCRKEEDDPREAILFFHPEEISENRRIAICGQLMGITHFLIDMFSAPKILCLENGKFALKDFGRRYVLALGCSSVTPDWLLEKQADILYQLTRFFHKDIDNILKTVDGDRSLLSAKLSVIMDHYMPISQHHGDLFALTFGILPILNLPKSANHISLSATVILQSCLLKEGVLGGIIMFQNKVIGAELIQELAQKLAFIQPYQLPPADHAKPKFKLPIGVQLLNVYVQRKYIQELRKTSSTYQFPSKCEPTNKNKTDGSKIDAIKEEDTSEMSFSSLGSKNQNTVASELPTSLRLETDNGAKIKFLKAFSNSDSPAEDNKKPEGISSADSSCMHKTGCGSGFLHSKKLFKSLENLTILQEEFDMEKIKRSSSLNDPFFPYIRCDGKSISKCLIEAYMYPDNPDGFPEDEERELDAEEFKSKYKSKSPEKKAGKKGSNIKEKFESQKLSAKGEKKVCFDVETSTSDSDTTTISETDSFNEKVKNSDFTLIKPPSSGLARPKDLALNTSSRTKSKRRWSTFEDMMSPLFENPPPVIEMEVPAAREKSASFSVNSNDLLIRNKNDLADSLVRNMLQNTFKKISSPSDDLRKSSASKDNEISLTLSLFDNKLINSPQHQAGSNVPKSSCSDENLEKYEDALLFIYSLGGMRLLLLLDKDCILNQSLLESLRDYGSSSISELEVAVSNVEEQSMSMGAGHHDHYCYLHYEPVWRSLAHGGRNHSMDFDIVQHMHQDFHIHPNINELIIRGDDHVVYGYQCVGSEVFYQQSAGPQPGLPMPSDLMGKVPFKAKRRLERDHNILLL